ncbi:chloramphenicol acetyltransferase [Paramecium bursaria Chlorella virus CVB-1]|nr:chloramphenicol acetyltransferase [Paramecium bursaria Chlorella virus CVB-1]
MRKPTNCKQLNILYIIIHNMKRPPIINNSRMTYGSIKEIHTGENASLKIGSFCSFADNIRAYLGGHHMTEYITTYPFGSLMPEVWGAERYGHPKSKGGIVIGSDVWIGDNVSLMPNITIGDGACIGCNAVVTKDVEPYSIVAGNPAKFIRYRFPEHIIDELLDISWWDLDLPLIHKLVPYLMNANVEENIPIIKKLITDYKTDA